MTTISEKQFDPIAFETKHQADFERSQRAINFVDNNCDRILSSSPEYRDGKQDGLINFQPTPQQWRRHEYREGYIQGILARYNQRFLNN